MGLQCLETPLLMRGRTRATRGPAGQRAVVMANKKETTGKRDPQTARRMGWNGADRAVLGDGESAEGTVLERPAQIPCNVCADRPSTAIVAAAA